MKSLASAQRANAQAILSISIVWDSDRFRM